MEVGLLQASLLFSGVCVCVCVCVCVYLWVGGHHGRFSLTGEGAKLLQEDV